MTRKIKAIALVKTDPIDGTFIDVEIYGNMKHLQETDLPGVPYSRIQEQIKRTGFFKHETKAGPEDNTWTEKVNIMVIPKELQRGERNMVEF